MSQPEIQFALLGLIPLTLLVLWIGMERKGASFSWRIGTGFLAGIGFCMWILAFSNSLGYFYTGMKQHRLLQSLIHAYPNKSSEIQTWGSEYERYRSFEHHSTKLDELKVILEME